MGIKRYSDNWQQLKLQLKKNDILEILSLSSFCTNKEYLEERLNFCKKRNIRLSVNNVIISSDFYMDILFILVREESEKKKKLKMAQYEGIKKALEKKKKGTGNYGRPRIQLPPDFEEQVKLYKKNRTSLELYRRKLDMKNSTFYKYANICLKNADSHSK